MSLARTSLLLAFAWLGAGCSGGLPEHATCTANADCTSGVCVEGYCGRPCTRDLDCPAPAPFSGLPPSFCGITADGSSACVRGCGPNSGYTCVAGVSTACARVSDPTRCLDCGCSDPSLPRCDPGVGCAPRSDVGGPCLEDDDCLTDDCSARANVCRVPVGYPCTTSNCDLCVTYPTGESFCSRECNYTSDCNGGACVRFDADPAYTCRPACTGSGDPSCIAPTFCGRTDDPGGGTWFCACTTPDECGFRAPLREIGERCTRDSDCTSGICIGPSGNGTCSASCTSDADCNAATRCGLVTCPSGVSDHCGALCMRTCVGDTSMCVSFADRCLSVALVGGGSATLCDSRSDDGSVCNRDADCISAACVGYRCQSASGRANGAPCTTSGDCASATCVSGICRGSARLGDACAIDADCSAGRCCTSRTCC